MSPPRRQSVDHRDGKLVAVIIPVKRFAYRTMFPPPRDGDEHTIDRVVVISMPAINGWRHRETAHREIVL